MATLAFSALSPADKACAALQLARAQTVDNLLRAQQRFEAARRAIQRLKGLAANVSLPIIPNLPAILDLDTRAYDQIRRACPMLNLPAVDTGVLAGLPGIAQLEALRRAYQGAVSSFLNRLESSALGLIDRIEADFNRYLDKVLNEVGLALSYLDCFCSGMSALQDLAKLDTAKAAYQELSKKPSLLDEELAGRMNTLRETKVQLKTILRGAA